MVRAVAGWSAVNERVPALGTPHGLRAVLNVKRWSSSDVASSPSSGLAHDSYPAPADVRLTDCQPSSTLYVYTPTAAIIEPGTLWTLARPSPARNDRPRPTWRGWPPCLSPLFPMSSTLKPLPLWRLK